MAFDLPPPSSSTNMFESLLVVVHPKLNSHICMGICALLCSFRNTRNDCIFNRMNFFLQVVFKAISWIHTQGGRSGAHGLLGATDERWSLGICSTDLVGGLSVRFLMHKAHLHVFSYLPWDSHVWLFINFIMFG